MKKEILYKLICIFMMLISALLMANDLINEPEPNLINMYLYASSFLIGGIYFYIILKKGKEKGKDIKNSNTEEDLKKGVRINWIIWSIMFGALAIYLIVCFLKAEGINTKLHSSIAPIKYILCIISAIGLACIYYVRRIMLKICPNNNSSMNNGHPSLIKTGLNQYTRAQIISLAIAESIGVYGLVYFFLTKDYLFLYILILISAIVMIIYRPKVKDLKQLILTMKHTQLEGDSKPI